MTRIIVPLLGLVLAGCGSSNSQTVDAGGQDGTTDAPGGSIALTSTAFLDGGTFPIDNTCKGMNVSPGLTWMHVPAGAQSLAVVLTDLSISLVHWVIYDIPPTAVGLPVSVENAYAPTNVSGAHQTVSVHAPTVGYYGPCPPAMHTYQFAVYALDVATLPGATENTMRTDAVPVIQAHQLATGTLTGTFTPP